MIAIYLGTNGFRIKKVLNYEEAESECNSPNENWQETSKRELKIIVAEILEFLEKEGETL